MGKIVNANALLAGLHVLEGFADMVIAKHEAGEHVTYGDVAATIAKAAPVAVEEAGVQDHVWREHKPAKRPGRAPAGGNK